MARLIGRPWLWAALCVAASGVAILIYVVTRPGPTAEPVPGDVAAESRVRKEPQAPVEPPIPTTFPAAAKWLSASTYLDKANRMTSRYDTDGDGIYDADEMLHYGTLRHDGKSRLDAHGTVVGRWGRCAGTVCLPGRCACHTGRT